MKRENVMVFFSLCFVIFAVILFAVLAKPAARQEGKTAGVSYVHGEERDDGGAVPGVGEEKTDISPENQKISAEDPETENETYAGSEEQSARSGDEDISMEDALFIGDSRTVGLMEYAQIQGADFFCTVGMSVFDISDKPVSMPDVGKVTLEELLSGKKYGKIYIMLGINEMGYPFESIVKEYRELIAFVRGKEPEAKIFLQANLHVTGERSEGDVIYNNEAINQLNKAFEEMADGQDIFYLDVNPLFDDENGNLSSDKSSDQTHLYAKYYEVWGTWITEQTALLVGGGSDFDGKR